MRTPIVEAVDVRRTFGRTTALAGVSLTVGTGITGLLGRNGAGKTTLMRILATAMPADGGRIRIAGFDPADPAGRLEIRRRLGYVPQEPGFHRSFTVFEFVDHLAILKEWTDRRARHDEVRRVLGLVDLESVAHRRIRSLSGGMRRRVAVAQALLGDPVLLVLDEPTAGLDPEQRLRFRDVVSTLALDRAVLLSTHQTEDVAALCDQVVVLADGAVRFRGDVPALAAVAAHRVWRSPQRALGAQLSWRGGDGWYRNIGDVAPPGAELVEPTIEDAYLLLAGRDAAVPA